MKTKSFLFSILFLFLSSMVFISCSPNSTDNELYENIEKSASGKSGQGSPGTRNGGDDDPDDDNL